MGTLATPDLNLPPSKETRAYRALEQVIRNDPVLSRTINTLCFWRGESKDLLAPAYSLCPYLKVGPWPTESAWITEGEHDMALTLHMEVAVKGTNFDNIANYWNAVRLAIFPQDLTQGQAVRAILRGAPTNDLVTRAEIRLNGFGWNTDGEGLEYMIANGAMKLGLHIPT